MKKVKLIYNPNSGEKSIIYNLDNIIRIYQKRDYTVIPYRLNKEENIHNAFLDIDDSYNHLVIAGGDGTIDMILNAMMEFNINIPIGILPLGTANDFANSLKLSNNINKAIENILMYQPK